MANMCNPNNLGYDFEECFNECYDYLRLSKMGSKDVLSDISSLVTGPIPKVDQFIKSYS